MTRVGTALGFSYAQTHNLLTPITIHSFWNSGVILLLTFLQVLTITLCMCLLSMVYWYSGTNMQILLVFTINFFSVLRMLLPLFVYIASRVRYQRIIAGNLMEKISPLHGCGASCTVYNTNPFLCLSALLSVL